jgi:hypothetical protein
MKNKLPATLSEMEWVIDRLASVKVFDHKSRAALRYANYVLAITRNYLGYETLADDGARNLEIALSKHCASELCQSSEI